MASRVASDGTSEMRIFNKQQNVQDEDCPKSVSSEVLEEDLALFGRCDKRD
jgi:hypothetical protein